MAGHASKASRTRTHMLSILRKLVRKGATKEAMIAALREQHPEIVRAEADEIQDLGLMSIANSLCNLKLGAEAGVQIDLFEGYDVPRTVTLQIADANGKIQGVIKSIDTLTRAEARQYVANHTNPRPKRSRKVEGIRRMLADIGDSGADDWSLKRCLKAAQAEAVSR